MRPLRYVLPVLILILGCALRLPRLTYGYSQVCQSTGEEAWLYDIPQPTSLFTWNIRNDPSRKAESPTRVIADTSDTFLALRFMSMAAGLITIALTIRLARKLKTNWWSLAGLFAATAPWFLVPSMWVVRFGPACLAVAISVNALVGKQRYRRASVWVQLGAALSLLLLAPSLWWLAIGLLLLQPERDWRIVLFILGIAVVSVPALQSPALWLASAQTWDSGAAAACVWGLLALALWRWPSIPPFLQGAGASALLLIGTGAMALNLQQHPVANAQQADLITYLQARVPDGAVVQFDPATWPLIPQVSCPHGSNVRLISQPAPMNFPFLYDNFSYQTPEFVVTTDRKSIQDAPIMQVIDNRFYVARMLKVPHPVDIRFGGLFYIIGYQLLTPNVHTGDWVDIRIDYQFSNSVTVDALRFAGFIHMTPLDDPATKIVNYNVHFVEESGFFGPRRFALNQHYRFAVPTDIPSGVYQLIFGIYDMYTGERLDSTQGTTLQIGQIEVSAPPTTPK